MKAITITKLRRNMKVYFDAITKNKEIVIIPRAEADDDSAVVMISLSEYNSLVETNYLLSTDANRKALMDSIAQDKKGESVSFNLDEEIEQI
jgi:antitoxin YefM